MLNIFPKSAIKIPDVILSFTVELSDDKNLTTRYIYYENGLYAEEWDGKCTYEGQWKWHEGSLYIRGNVFRDLDWCQCLPEVTEQFKAKLAELVVS